MNLKTVVIAFLFASGGVALGDDYTWLAQPQNADWLGSANWDRGVWSPNADNTAAFGASDVFEINVNGEVALARLTVNADLAFTNGTLALNGPFAVGGGATAVVDSGIRQTDAGTSGTRFDKSGPGTLVLTGTNEFHRLRVSDGLLHFRGGAHDVVGTHTGPNESQVVLSLARGKVLIDDGAVVTVTNQNNYFSNSGAEVVISNATFKVAAGSEFLNGFKDNNKEFNSAVSSVTVETNGVLFAGNFRLSKGEPGGEYGVLRVNRGGTVKIREFSMDSDARNYAATLIFDGGKWEAINDGMPGTAKELFRLGRADVETYWPKVTVALGAGGLHYFNRHNSYFHKGITPAAGVERDGGVHFTGGNVTYWRGDNSYTGGNYLEGTTGGGVVSVSRDTSFGAVPSEPEDNVFLRSTEMQLHINNSITIHSNRNFRIGADANFGIGTMDWQTSRIMGTFSPEGTGSVVRVSDWWSGWTELCPPEGRTNVFQRLQVYGPLRIGSGTTLVTQDCGTQIDEKSVFFIRGNDKTFGGKGGHLSVTGGVLRVTEAKSQYTIASKYGQVEVTGGLFDTSAQLEYINGLESPARTTVSGTGELRAGRVRISQSAAIDPETGLPVCAVNVCTGGVLRLNSFYIDEKSDHNHGCLNFDGGTVAARQNNDNFLGTDREVVDLPKGWNSPRWTNILARVCAGGAVIDSDAFNITVKRPLISGAEQDGGLTKKGGGTLTLTSTNTYNGATRVAAGRLVFSHAEGFPGGHLEFPGATLQAKDETTALVEMQSLTFRPGCKVRVPYADALDEKTFRGRKVVAKMATALASVPELVFLNDDGNERPSKAWKLYLGDGGKTLLFGCSRGTVMIYR